MTTEDHVDRVRKLAEQARQWEAQEDPYCSTPKVCNCQTCGVVNARLRAALKSRGWGNVAVHHVRVEGYDFRGGCDPYLASVKVEHSEVARAYSDLSELLADDVLDDIERVLRRLVC